METTFTKDDTKVIKGIAVILMLKHHLRAFSGQDHWRQS